MAGKTENQQARDTVEAYYEKRLRELVDHVVNELDQYRTGRRDVFAVDDPPPPPRRNPRVVEVLLAGGGSHLRMTARLIDEQTAGGQLID